MTEHNFPYGQRIQLPADDRPTFYGAHVPHDGYAPTAAAPHAAPEAPESFTNDDKMFTYASRSGIVRVRSLARMPVGVIRKVRKLDQADQFFTMLEMVAPEYLEVVDQWDGDELADFLTKWQRWSGVGLGE